MHERELVIVKLGGSAITDKRAVKKPRIEVIDQVSYELSRIINESNYNIILVLGGGSFGHPLAKKYELHRGLKNPNSLIGLSETIDSMRELSMIISRSLREKGVPAIPIQPSSIAINRNSHLVHMHIDILEKFIKLGTLPILWGDVVIDEQIGVSILSGDNIISYIANKMKVKKIVFGLDIDGFYKDPRNFSGLISVICEDNIKEILNLAGESSVTDVTGGMARKIREILPLYENGATIYLVNITKKDYLYRTLINGENLGTKISKKCSDY